MIDKDKLRRIWGITKKVVTIAAIAALVTATGFAAKFTYDFFAQGIFGGGKSSGLMEEFFPGAEPEATTVPTPTETQPITETSLLEL